MTTVLGLRASVACCPTSPQHQMLSMAQAIWYMPQGLDVWDHCCASSPGTTPGTTRMRAAPRGHGRGGERPLDARPGAPHAVVPDRPRGRTGRARWSSACSACRRGSWRGTSRGPTRWPWGSTRSPGGPARRGLESQLLFCAIIDLQDTLQQRKLQNIEHKALRARALVSLARLVGWEQARPLLYCVVPDIACFPRLYPLFDLSTRCWGPLQERPVHPQGAQPQRHVPKSGRP